MNSIKTRKTANQAQLIPSTFGMPACGHAFGDVNITGDMGLAVRAYVPGTSAWSPPPS